MPATVVKHTDTLTKRVPAWPVINQLCFPERHFSANCISLRLGEVQMKFYERSLQGLLSSAPRGFAALSRALARLVSLAQIYRRACSDLTYKLDPGAYQTEPPSPIQALGVNPFPSRFIIRTVPRGDFARRRWEEPFTTTK